MVTSSALPATLKLKLAARYVPYLLRHASDLDAGDPLARGGDRLEGESVAEWGHRELGADFVELLAYPLLGAYYGSAPESTSVVLYHALARAGLDVSVYGVRGGTGQLFEAAADHLAGRGVQFRRGVEVTRAVAGASGVAIDGEPYDGAILAVPPSVVRRLCALPETIQRWLADARFASSAVLALVLKERVRADYFGVSVPRSERASDLVALCVQQQKLPGLVPMDRSLLIALGAPGVNDELIAHPQTAVDRMITAVEEIMPGTRALIAHAKLYRHAEGYPVFYPGYLKHLRAFPAHAIPRVMLAGDYLVSPTVEGAVRSGERAALRLHDQLRAVA
jgi:oxygen-dependent protoporphyrinogen oxidase